MGPSKRAIPARARRHTAVMSGEDSTRLARALIEFREAEGISERELARRTWLSEATIRTFERGRGDLPTPTVARSFEELLGWAPGSIKTAPSEAMGREASADSAKDLE
ncbi:helix-turn-helix domain-containing protein [Streptomyces olivochromogenes]|nr:helix-turn-helix domain-containing protein [Streptomyces olivochromogenes]